MHAAVDACMAAYAIDADRRYATGLRMGGTGAWHVAAARPGRFAALVPLSGAYPDDGDGGSSRTGARRQRAARVP